MADSAFDVNILVRNRNDPAQAEARAEPPAPTTPQGPPAHHGPPSKSPTAGADKTSDSDKAGEQCNANDTIDGATRAGGVTDTAVAEPARSDTSSSADAPLSMPAPHARGLWLNGLFACVALGAAAIALTAPSLRPMLVQQAPAVLPAGWGDASVGLANILTPETQTDRDVTALLSRVSGLEAEVLRLRLDIRQLDRRLVEAGTIARDDRRDIAGITRITEESGQRINRIEQAGQVLAERVRAATLLAAATRLRRDVDAGTALTEGVALMDLNNPYPETVAQAVETLRRMPAGVTTMRDLAIEYETLDQAIAASLGQDGSGWSRLRALFGGAEDPRLSFLERVRQMAAEGRMAEVATLLAHSPWKTESGAWVGRVRDRTEAARATQAISAYAIAQARTTNQVPPEQAPPDQNPGVAPTSGQLAPIRPEMR